ncbi:MAG: cell division protein FtsQ/DivIB [Hyphomonadaceae bacterium]|nr:cell division protein FtsQ/DivIB [Hyphomonadaceae bacterium]MBX3511474.1 cell division protein FtsQ/DivIB [Hyphomonadaceae bacterium]
MPRLAQIKLNGGLQSDDVQVSGKSLALALGGVVVFAGLAIAGAAWLGSSLFDVREAMARSADGAAASMGFTVDTIEVEGVNGARAQEVRAVVTPEGRHSVLSLDPADVRTRVESLDWVARARVQRLWPSTMRISVERRQAYARWQEDGEISVIDYNGERLLAERAADHGELPLVVGAGAGPAAEPLLIALENLPQVRARLEALVRVGNRRWNVELVSGTTIALPEQGAAEALAQLERLQSEHRLLDRPLAQIDMRAPGRVAVRVHPVLAGGMRPLLGGA